MAIIPADMGPFMAVITGVLSIPMTFFMSNDAFYFGVLPVLSETAAHYGVSAADALAYGVILQAVEIATAVGLGVPALVREGMSWSDVRLRALSAAPVRLQPVEPDERIRA